MMNTLAVLKSDYRLAILLYIVTDHTVCLSIVQRKLQPTANYTYIYIYACHNTAGKI